MKRRCGRIPGALILSVLCAYVAAPHAAAQTRSSGKLAGVVQDATGTPQLGAHVELIAEALDSTLARSVFTNPDGLFHSDRLPQGLYTVRVTLAGFLPTLQQHVRISAHLTTIVHVQLESMFASLDQLRRQPAAATAEADDWKWVLRSAVNTRPVLQWADDGSLSASDMETQLNRPKARVEFTDGAPQPGFVSGVPVSPATAFAFEQKAGNAGQLIFAGQMNYQQDAPGGGFATVWSPVGALGMAGPQSTLVVREEKLGPTGPTYRAARLDQSGAIPLNDHTILRYGGEYVLVGMQKTATAMRPRADLETRLSSNWTATVLFAAQPDGPAPLGSDAYDAAGSLQSALAEFDDFPALMKLAGRPVLQGGWHEEVSANRKVGSRGTLELAGFHDDDHNIAILGKGSSLPAAEYLQEFFANGFAYDGGSMSSWGTRVAFEEKVTDSVAVTAIYAYAGALSPAELTGDSLRSVLQPGMHNSVGANVSAKVRRTGTQFNAGYQWMSGAVVSPVDSYGEALFNTAPYLHMGVHQNLPKFGPGRWEAVAECDNALAQGYVPTKSPDGNVLLIPSFRSFRGGLSVQF